MPPPRGTVLLCDHVDLLGEALVSYFEVEEELTGDGLVTPDDRQLLRAHQVLVRQTFRTLPAEASAVDGAMRAIGCIAHAGKVSRKARDVTKEAYEDGRALVSA